MILFEARCKKCGSYAQLVYTPETNTLRGSKCDVCGAELSHPRKASIEHHLDGLTSAFSGTNFIIKSARFM